ncbi:MAG: N-glycosylase [Thermoproteota archaeon]|nr:MAG: N-glycosylase [Candidatus Korarchaeota archaeon]
MMEFAGLVKTVMNLKEDIKVRRAVERRLREFEFIGRSDKRVWFREMAFCLLAANFSAVRAYRIALGLERSGLLFSGKEDKIASYLKLMGHRFYNTRAAFIVGARSKLDCVYNKVPRLRDFEAREWLRKEIRGFGMKEASHFLRNIGRKDLAIIDRHVLRMMIKHGVISNIPRVLTRKRYLLLEDKLREIARLCDASLAELDLYLWYSEKGFVFR